jgi:hypothetical protein
MGWVRYGVARAPIFTPEAENFAATAWENRDQGGWMARKMK